MKKLLLLFSFLILFSNASLADAACNLYDESANVSSLYKRLALGHFLNQNDFNTLSQEEKELFLNQLFNQERSLNPKISLETIEGCNGISLPLRFSKRDSNQNEFAFEEVFNLPEDLRASELFNGFRYFENREITKNLSDFCEGDGSTKTCSFAFRYPNSENEDSEDILGDSGYFEFECSGNDCNKNIKINIEFSVIDNTLASSLCSIPEGGVYFDAITFPDDEESITNLIVKLNLKTTQECSNKSIQIYLKERDTFQATDNIIDVTGSSDFVYWTGTERSIYTNTPTDEDLWITFKAHEDDCELRPGLWDCKIYVEVVDQDQVVYSSYEYLDGSLYSDNFENNINFKKGVIASECSGDGCELIGNDWKYLDNNGTLPSEQVGDPAQIETTKPKYDRKSPCWREDVDLEKPGKQEGYDPNCYEFLAPIPGLGNEQIVEGVTTGRVSIDLKSLSLADYINKIFQIALGILMVLSVVMIVIAGVQYMTVESIYGKSDAKSRIVSSVVGLILALSIFIILDTINPKLLEVDFEDSVPEVLLNTVVDPAALDGDGTSPTVSNAPATAMCNNRKDRGYWKGQNQLKLTKIAETASNVPLGSLVTDGVNINTGAPQGTSISKKVELEFSNRVKSMIQSLNNQGITTRITEAFGPSFLGHGSPCHYLGSCIDLATGSSAGNATYTEDNVEKIIRTADQNGLTAQFEFSNAQSQEAYASMQNELNSRGIDKCMIKYVTHATNWHFSVYDKISPELTL